MVFGPEASTLDHHPDTRSEGRDLGIDNVAAQVDTGNQRIEPRHTSSRFERQAVLEVDRRVPNADRHVSGAEAREPDPLEGSTSDAVVVSDDEGNAILRQDVRGPDLCTHWFGRDRSLPDCSIPR